MLLLLTGTLSGGLIDHFHTYTLRPKSLLYYTSAVPVRNMPIAWSPVLLPAAFSRTAHPNTRHCTSLGPQQYTRQVWSPLDEQDRQTFLAIIVKQIIIFTYHHFFWSVPILSVIFMYYMSCHSKVSTVDRKKNNNLTMRCAAFYTFENFSVWLIHKFSLQQLCLLFRQWFWTPPSFQVLLGNCWPFKLPV